MFSSLRHDRQPLYEGHELRDRLERRLAMLAKPESDKELLGLDTTNDIDTFWFCYGLAKLLKVEDTWRQAEDKLFAYRVSRLARSRHSKLVVDELGLPDWRHKGKVVPVQDVPPFLYSSSASSFWFVHPQTRQVVHVTDDDEIKRAEVYGDKVHLAPAYLTFPDWWVSAGFEDALETEVVPGLWVDHALLLHHFRTRVLLQECTWHERVDRMCASLDLDPLRDIPVRDLFLQSLGLSSFSVIEPPCIHRARQKGHQASVDMFYAKETWNGRRKMGCNYMKMNQLCPFDLQGVVSTQLDIEDLGAMVRGKPQFIPGPLIHSIQDQWRYRAKHPNRRCALLHSVVMYPDHRVFVNSPMDWT